MSDDERIADLETRLAYQENTIEELSSVVAEQARVLELLREQLRRLTGRMETVEDALPGETPDDTPPPHY
ncbi:MAG: SlyX family protein [Alphaproteobacteria bacterium]|nr:SlyX family protein [Alphaproteobacteria bacterium]